MRLLELALLCCFAAIASAAVVNQDGYAVVQGRCENYVLEWRHHWTVEQCADRCNALEHCYSFTHFNKKWHNRFDCEFRSETCQDKLYTLTDDPLVYTYVRLGAAPPTGFLKGFGECPGAKYFVNHRNQNPRDCGTLCMRDKRCKHIQFYSAGSHGECKLSSDTCDYETELINNDGKHRVYYVNQETGINYAYATSVAMHPSQAHHNHPNYLVYAYPWNHANLGPYCAVSNGVHRYAWYKINLGTWRSVKTIVLQNRADCCQDENVDFDVVVSPYDYNMNQPRDKLYRDYMICGRVEKPFFGKLEIDCGEPMIGKHIIINYDYMGFDRRVGLCEVEAYGSKENLLDLYEKIEKTFVSHNVHGMPFNTVHSPGHNAEHCAIMCMSLPRCHGFGMHTNSHCYFVYYGGDPNVRHVDNARTLYLKRGFGGMEIPGYTRTSGGCLDAGFSHFKADSGFTARKCSRNCNQVERCQSFLYDNTNSHCYLYDKPCEKPATDKDRNFFYNKLASNAAQGGDARQISTYAGRAANLATDGLLSADPKLGSCSETKPARITWWSVDLRFNTEVSAVGIYNRQDCRECQADLRKFTIYVSKTQPYPGQQFSGMDEEICARREEPITKYAQIRCDTKRSGRYVIIKRTLEVAKPLILCEVAVYGTKDYNVHGFEIKPLMSDCSQNNIKEFSKLTPGQCADECNKSKYCASFVYQKKDFDQKCWLKSRHCSTQNAKQDPNYMYYDKIGHPGFSVAGYTTRRGFFHHYHIGDYGNLDPSQCAAKCNALKDCVGMRMYWTSHPRCYPLRIFPDNIKYHENDHYYTLLRNMRFNNIAINKQALASASYDKSEHYATDGTASPWLLHKSCARVQPVEGRSWWAVDLVEPHHVSGVRILSDKDNSESKLKDIVLIVSDNKPLLGFDETEVCVRQAGLANKPGEYLELNCEFPIMGRYAIVMKDANEDMNLCEVMVAGVLADDKNVALKKETDQSSTEGTGIPAKAVDGKYNSHIGADTCAQTMLSMDNRTAWWSVDLGKTHAVSAIKIRNRADCCGEELREITISISMNKPDWNFEVHEADVCNYWPEAIPLNTTWSFRCRTPGVGRYVIISKNIPKLDLVLCEVEVLGREIELPAMVAYYPLIASYKGKDLSPGKSDGIITNAKSALGPLKQPYTAFHFTDLKSSKVAIRNTDVLPLHREFTIMTYVYQGGHITDGVILKYNSRNIILRIQNKRIGVLLEGYTQTYQALSNDLIDPDTWYFVGATVNMTRGDVSVFVNSRFTTAEYGGAFNIMPVTKDDITISGRFFRGSMSCLQIYNKTMDIIQILAAKASCKTYLKVPGDAASNVAKGKPAFQSSVWLGAGGARAVDGSTAPYFWRDSCTATIQGPKGMNGPHWWAVDLQMLREVTSVKIYNRLDCCADRLRNFRVLVTLAKPTSPIGYDPAEVCYYHRNAFKGGQSKILPCKRSLPGRYVAIKKEDVSQLTLCEVEVYGDPILPQPKSAAHEFLWQCNHVKDIRRKEDIVIHREVPNVRLCQRLCLLETQFRCRTIEYDREMKWCRLYRNTRDITVSTASWSAAMNGTIFVEATEQQTLTQSEREERERKRRITQVQRSITENTAQKQRLIDMGLAEAQKDTIRLYDDRIQKSTIELEALTIGTVKEKKDDEEIEGKEDLMIQSQSQYVYCKWVSVGSGGGADLCPKRDNEQTEKTWSSSENWVLNVIPDLRFDNVDHAWECKTMCEREKNFKCMSFAYNNELRSCSLFSVNPAEAGVELIPKQHFTYHQWACQKPLKPCICYIGGDPHYRTFDKKYYDNQKACKYMGTHYVDPMGICSFDFEHKNEYRGGRHVSWIAVMDLKILGHVVRLQHGGQLWYDGQLMTDLADANSRNPNIQIRKVGGGYEVNVPSCAVSMKYDMIYNFYITVSRRKYAGKLQGLCGNCDGNINNDWIPKGSTQNTGNLNHFIQSWEVVDDTNLGHVCQRVTPTTPCEGEWKTKVTKKEYCGLIKDYHGPFGQCIRDAKVDQNQLYNDCVYDVCSFMHNPTQAREMACGGIEKLVEKCSIYGLPIKAWRSPEFCPLDCGANMEYKPVMTGCPATCSDPEAPKNCTAPNAEGCTCMTGFVLNDQGKCVVEELCAPKSLADIAFCLDQSEVMGSKLSTAARNLVADIVDTFHISEKTTQVNVIPYAANPADAILYSHHGSRSEIVEAIRSLPFLGGPMLLPKCVRYVHDNIFNEKLAKLRPQDTYIRILIIVTSSDVAEDDAVTDLTKPIWSDMGKVVWIKYDSETAPPPGELTIPPYVFPIGDPDEIDDAAVDELTFFVYKESKCKGGFYNKRYADYERCEDIDECRLELCTKGSTCVNTIGSYKCMCPDGYCFSSHSGCEEINECDRNPCLPGSTCKNTKGSYECQCRPGFRYDEKRSCVDIDECTELEKNPCHGIGNTIGTCVNLPGSYKCNCDNPKLKYFLEGFGCYTKNYCLTGRRCKINSVCVAKHKKVFGRWYDCVCPDGMYYDKAKGCLLKMPCGDKPCKGDKVTCVQHQGDYQCLCPTMHEYHPERGCEPIDPCAKQPCKGKAQCTSKGTEFYCGCPREMYYNPKIGCEEPEMRAPKIKVVMILDDSDKVGQRNCKYVKDAATNIGKTLAGKSETLDMGIWLAGGRAEMVLTQAVRPTEDYAEQIANVECTGGRYVFPDTIDMITKNPELNTNNVDTVIVVNECDKDTTAPPTIDNPALNNADNETQIIVVVITGNNVDHTHKLEPMCSSLERTTGAKCNYMVILFGHNNVADPLPENYILLQYAVELFQVHVAIGVKTSSWLTCPAGFYRIGNTCRIASSVLYKCTSTTGQSYAADAVWTDDCITYKCVRNGPTVIKAECQNAAGKCRPSDGSFYPCLIKGEYRERCRCTVKEEDGRVVRKVSSVEYVTPPAKVVSTYGGNGEGKPCVFPFFYNNRLWEECTTKNTDTPWCSTTDNFDIDKKWGFCKPDGNGMICQFDGKNFYEGQTWWDNCVRYACTPYGIQVQYAKCKSKGERPCVQLGTEDFPCEINGKNYDSCVCSGTKNKVEMFAVSSRETVEEAYGGGNAESFCAMGKKEYALGDKWEKDCSNFECVDRKTLSGGETIGASVQATKIACKVQVSAAKWICLDIGKTENNCGKDTKGDPRSCTCKRDGEGLEILYKSKTTEYSISAATSQYTYNFFATAGGEM